MNSEGKCPVMSASHRHTAAGAFSNRDWWPNQLKVQILHQNSTLSDPMGETFNYAEEFKSVDLDALKQDIEEVMTIEGILRDSTLGEEWGMGAYAYRYVGMKHGLYVAGNEGCYQFVKCIPSEEAKN